MNKRIARVFDHVGVYVLLAPAMVVGLATAAVGAPV
jgi:hypothetical protein